MEAVSNACHNLTSVTLEGCKMERSIVHNIIGVNVNLRHLNLSGLLSVSNSTCRLLAHNCQKLEVIDVSWCPSINSHGIKRLLESCKNLKVLKAAETAKFDESSPCQALFRANNLEELTLSGSKSVTDESIRIMVEGRRAEVNPLTGRITAPSRNLRFLNLSKCLHLTDKALQALAHNVPNLQALQLAGCDGLTDEGFKILFPTLFKLTHLDIEECTQVTDNSILALANAPCAATLEHLQLSYCELVGDVGLAPLVKKCPNLRNLEIDNSKCHYVLESLCHTLMFLKPVQVISHSKR